MRLYKTHLLLTIILFCYSCTWDLGSDCIEGDENVEKRAIEIESISKIELSMSGSLYVNEGPQYIEIEAPADIIDRIIQESKVGSDKWEITLEKCYNGSEIKVWATLPQFQDLTISGSGSINSIDVLRNIENLNLEVNGSGDIDVEVEDGEKLDLEISGSGNANLIARNVRILSYLIQGSGNIVAHHKTSDLCKMKIEGSGNIESSGNTLNQIVEIEGDGDVSSHALCATQCDINTAGSGDCEVKVSDNLSVKIEGSGSICYKGQPAINSNIDGSGKIINCN